MRIQICSVMILMLCLSGSFGLSSSAAAKGNTYYVDSLKGDDSLDGKSIKTAWKTIDKVNAETFAPGSKVMLKAGGVYPGTVSPKGSGTPEELSVITSYGTGPKPRVNGVLLHNVECWEVRDLDISGGYIGVYVQLVEFGVARNIRLRNLDIHDINGGTTGDTGGIICSNSGEKTIFDGLLIEECNIKHADRNGILISDYPNATDKHRSINVVVRGNNLNDIGGDGIFILACKGALIERNVVRYAHQRVGREPGERACAGIWPHRCENTLIQFNEVSHTAVGGKTIWDSEGFDDDLSCVGSIFQYNYSHDNLGGFLLVCGGKDVIARYNVSRNDGTATFTFEIDSVSNCKIYNNTIYIKKGMDVNFARNTFGTPRGLQFVNNIIYADGTMRYNFGGIKNITFDNNAFFGNHIERPADEHALTANPKLVNPNQVGDGFATANGFKLKPGSPCIGAGKATPYNNVKDFWGNIYSLSKIPSIGANNP